MASNSQFDMILSYQCKPCCFAKLIKKDITVLKH